MVGILGGTAGLDAGIGYGEPDGVSTLDVELARTSCAGDFPFCSIAVETEALSFRGGQFARPARDGGGQRIDRQQSGAGPRHSHLLARGRTVPARVSIATAKCRGVFFNATTVGGGRN
jgi:hypothetical protein